MAGRERKKGEAEEEIRRRKKSVELAPEKLKAQDGASEVDPIGSVVSELSPEGHAALLGDARFSHRANIDQKARMVTELQQNYGNDYVQRVVGRIQAKRDDQLSHQELPDDIAQRIVSEKGSGKPLRSETRSQMEASFGTDFGDVRVHTDAAADRLATELRAKAFTTGKDVFFRGGAYEPGSQRGKRLLAHELTHVVQQSDFTPGAPSGAIRGSQLAEAEAEAAGKAAMLGQPVGDIPSGSGTGVQLTPEEGGKGAKAAAGKGDPFLVARGELARARPGEKGGAAEFYLVLLKTAIASAKYKEGGILYYSLVLRPLMEGLWDQFYIKVLEHRRHLLALACLAKAAGPGVDPLEVAKFCKTYQLPLTLPVVGLISRVIGKLDITRAIKNGVKLIALILPVLESIRMKNAALVALDKSVVPAEDAAEVGSILETARSPKEVIEATQKKESEVSKLKTEVENYALALDNIEKELGVGKGE